MNLVIKNQHEESENGERIYRDALVSEGTLMLVDFSNGGTTFNKDLTKGVYDLARDAAELIGLYTSPEFLSKTTLPTLSDKDGLPLVDLGAFGTSDFDTGLNFHGIGKYLYENQPRTLMTFWLELDTSRGNLRDGRIISTPDSGGVGNNLRVLTPSAVNTTISANLAGKSTLSSYNIGNKTPTQVSIEYVNSSTPSNIYINGELLGVGSAAEGGFTQPTENDLLSIGFKSVIGNNSMATLYRFMLEDLTKSGRTASQVVAKDYNYVNQLGEFASKPTKRPFANVV